MRVADNPPSQEQLFLLDYARHNASVGEDMRDKLVAVELITEPAVVVRYCILRDAAMHHAVPYEQFAAQAATAK